MRTEKNVSLKKFNTFGLDYVAACMIHVKDENEAITFFKSNLINNEPLLVLGGGSNILFTGDFSGTIIHPEIEGIKFEKQSGNDVIVSAGSGINWDTFVEWTVSRGFYGLENLSFIPGNVGATPIQNIGAYGTEVRKSIEKVETISISDGLLRCFSNSECGFGYRNSIFKGSEKGKYLVTKVHYKLKLNSSLNLDYGSLREEIKKLGGETLSNTRKAVINIRKSKLPDPLITGNAGSFFKNPVIPRETADNLKTKYPSMPVYDDHNEMVKLAAGWLIEQAGWKGKRSGNAGVHSKQALVIINHGNAGGSEIFTLSEAVRKSVFEKFGIELEREVEVIPSI